MHGIGDTICSLPLIAYARKLYPQGYICVLVKTKAGKEIIEASELQVDKIVVLDVYKSLSNTLKIIWQLRLQSFDYGISAAVTPVKKSQLFMRLVGVNKHIGLQTKRINAHTLVPDIHFVTANIMSIMELGDIVDQNKLYVPKLYVDDTARRTIEKLVIKEFGQSKTIAVCIGNADYTLRNRFFRTGKVYPKAWGIQNFVDLIKLLYNENYTIFLIGGQAEVSLLPYLSGYLSKARVVNLVGKCNIKESIAALSFCHCSVGIDTGMQHVAAALNIPSVSIFGPTNPKRCGGYCSKSVFVESDVPCKYCYGSKLYVNCFDRKCLANIRPKAVFEAIQQALN